MVTVVADPRTLRRPTECVHNSSMRSFVLPWLFLIPAAVFVACGGDSFTSVPGALDSGASDGSVVADTGGDAAGCVPKTCASQRFACGKADDGCGKALDCGACHVANFDCQTDHACRCTPKTCFGLGFTCGDTVDGCGKPLNCGTCTNGFTCGGAALDGGAGMDHRCGPGTCTKKTCAQIGAQCGMPSDGCGGILDCGRCAGTNDKCDATNKCVCVPSTCGQLGWVCGSGPDGCGGTLDCGSTCSSMQQVCSGHSCVNMNCTPTTSCAMKGYSCGVIFNGCANETCGSGPPSRDTSGDVLCAGHAGKPNFYGCMCISGTSLFSGDGGTVVDSSAPDSAGPPDSGGPLDSGTITCGNGAPNPPIPGYNCDVVTPSPLGGTGFCCTQ